MGKGRKVEYIPHTEGRGYFKRGKQIQLALELLFATMKLENSVTISRK